VDEFILDQIIILSKKSFGGQDKSTLTIKGRPVYPKKCNDYHRDIIIILIFIHQTEWIVCTVNNDDAEAKQVSLKPSEMI